MEEDFYTILSSSDDFKGIFSSVEEMNEAIINNPDEFYSIVNESKDFKDVFSDSNELLESAGLKKKESTEVPTEDLPQASEQPSQPSEQNGEGDVQVGEDKGLQLTENIDKVNPPTLDPRAIEGRKAVMLKHLDEKSKETIEQRRFIEEYAKNLQSKEYVSEDEKEQLQTAISAYKNSRQNIVNERSEIDTWEQAQDLKKKDAFKAFDDAMFETNPTLWGGNQVLNALKTANDRYILGGGSAFLSQLFTPLSEEDIEARVQGVEDEKLREQLRESYKGSSEEAAIIKKNLIDYANDRNKIADERNIEGGIITNLDQIEEGNGLDMLRYGLNAVVEGGVQIPAALLTFGGSSFIMTSGMMYLDAANEVAEEYRQEGLSEAEAMEKALTDEKINKLAINTGATIVAGMDLFGAGAVLKGVGGKKVQQEVVKKFLNDFVRKNAIKEGAKKVGKATLETGIEVATEIGQEFVEAGAGNYALEGTAESILEGFDEITIDDIKDIALKTAIGASPMTIINNLNDGKKVSPEAIKEITEADNQLLDFTYQEIENRVQKGELSKELASEIRGNLDADLEAYNKIKEVIPESKIEEALPLQRDYEAVTEQIKETSGALKPFLRTKQKELEEKLLNLIDNGEISEPSGRKNEGPAEQVSTENKENETEESKEKTERVLEKPEILEDPTKEQFSKVVENGEDRILSLKEHKVYEKEGFESLESINVPKEELKEQKVEQEKIVEPKESSKKDELKVVDQEEIKQPSNKEIANNEVIQEDEKAVEVIESNKSDNEESSELDFTMSEEDKDIESKRFQRKNKIPIKKVYKKNDAIKSIGTNEEYLEYLSKKFDGEDLPKLYYHGTNAKFDKFSANKLGSNTKNKDAITGVFLSENPDVSSLFIDSFKDKNLEGNLMTVLVHPKKIKDEEESVSEFFFGSKRKNELIAKAIKEGYDGIRFGTHRRSQVGITDNTKLRTKDQKTKDDLIKAFNRIESENNSYAQNGMVVGEFIIKGRPYEEVEKNFHDRLVIDGNKVYQQETSKYFKDNGEQFRRFAKGINETIIFDVDKTLILGSKYDQEAFREYLKKKGESASKVSTPQKVSKKIKNPTNKSELEELYFGSFGLNKKESKSAALISDVIIEKLSIKEGIRKEDFYKKINWGDKSTFNKLTNEGKTLYQFVGENANLKREILEKVKFAKHLEKDKRSVVEIKKLTGWEKGKDGKWRYEVNPVQVSNFKYNKSYKLKDLIVDEELLNAYPQLDRIFVRIESPSLITKLIRKTGGGIFFRNLDMVIIYPVNNKEIGSILSHELQHAIQEIEGFAQGGSPDTFKKEENRKYLRDTRKPNYDAYQRISGEVEARNVQKRREMSSQERKNSTIESTEDIARDEQIVLFQEARGAIVKSDMGYTIYSLTDPNISTPLHELAHIYEDYLSSRERDVVINSFRADQLKKGQEPPKDTKWNDDVSEYFARGFEKYLSEGKTSNPKLKEVFENFKKWLTDIYNGIKGSDIDVLLNNKMRDIYDRMLQEQPAKPKSAASKNIEKGISQLKNKDNSKVNFNRLVNVVYKRIDNAFANDEITDEEAKQFEKQVEELSNENEGVKILYQKSQSKEGLDIKLGVPKMVIKKAINALVLSYRGGKNINDAIEEGIKYFGRNGYKLNETKKKQFKAYVINELKKNSEKKPKPKVDKSSKRKKKKENSKYKVDDNAKSLLTRAYDGVDDAQLKALIKEYGLDRETESWQTAKAKAVKFINDAGLKASLDAVRRGAIQGAPAAYVWSENIDAVWEQIGSETDAKKVRELRKYEAALLDEFSQQATKGGQFNSALQDIYANSEFGYKAETQIKNWKARNDGQISEEMEDRFYELEAELDEVNKKLESALKAREEAEQLLAIENIQKSIEREGKKEEAPAKKDRYKDLANKLRKGKIRRPGIFMSATPASIVWDGAIEVAAKTIETTGSIAEATKKAVEFIKKSKWYKSLSNEQKDEAEEGVTEYVKGLTKDAPEVEVIDRKIKIPHKLIKSRVAEGFNTPKKLVESIKKDLIEEYPFVTDRQISDAISNYGRTEEMSKDELSKQVRSIKRRLATISKIQDAKEGKRPKRTGLQRDIPTPEERALNKELNELLKVIPISEEESNNKVKTRLEASKQRLRNQIEDLDREIKENKRIERTSKAIVKDIEYAELEKKRDELKKKHDEVFYDIEKLERKRLETAKNTALRRIQFLNKRIANKDFSKKKPKKPLIVDDEYTQLLAEKIEAQEQFDKLQYEDELKNRTRLQKVFDGLNETWNLTRALRATAELSPILIQGGLLTVANPKIAAKAFRQSMKNMVSEKKSQEWLRKVRAQEYYSRVKESKLAITEPDAKMLAREEAFMTGWVNTFFDKAFFGKFNPTKSLERAGTTYLNEIRLRKFLEAEQMMQERGLSYEENRDDYKQIARVINTMTGRTSLDKAEMIAKPLSNIFFSPRNTLSTLKLLAIPWTAYQARTENSSLNKPNVAQKMLLGNFMRQFTFVASTIMVLNAMFGEEDDEWFTVEMDPRSSDFMKLRLGDTRIDPWRGMQQLVVLMARLISDSTKSTTTGEIKTLGKGVTPTRLEYFYNTLGKNKLHPSASMIEKYATSEWRNVDGEEVRTDAFGNEIGGVMEQTTQNLYPIYFDTLKELFEEQPTMTAAFLAFIGFFGIGTSTYEPKETKKKKRRAANTLAP